MNSYLGSCHCGSVEFSVDSDLADPVWCNCSFCVRRGAVLQKVSAEQFSLSKGEEHLSRYGEREFSDHYFCSNCGIHVFTRSSRNGEDAVVVSLHCLKNVDLDAITPRTFDGATLL
jgi:hypothetical protein